MKRGTVTGFAVIFLFLLFIPNIHALSVAPGFYRFDFEPNMKKSLTFMVWGVKKLNISYKGADLDPYITLNDPAPGGGPRTVQLLLDLPETMPKPGQNGIEFVALEIREDNAQVGGVAEIHIPILIQAPYPGTYAEMKLFADSVNQGQDVEFKILVNNLGKKDLSAVTPIVKVYSTDNNELIKTIKFDTKSVESGVIEQWIEHMKTTDVVSGPYLAVGNVTYDGGNVIGKNKGFKVGHLYMAISNYSKVLQRGKINKFFIDVESQWNSHIKNVYGTITINGTTEKTPSYAMRPWANMRFAGHFDASELELDEYDAEFAVYYEDQFTKEEGKVRIVDEIKEVTPEIVEEPTGINTTTLAIAGLSVVIVLLIILIIVLLIKKKKE
ncbi:MAG: hypothetical protein MAG795_00044 [Candidatus Woesearchaeota archaeon]|nr:hypothetical protein [Candidatus Woesearchaeota archaeon]